MVITSNNKTSVLLGLLVCALGISVSSSADARKANRQGTYVEQGYPNPTPGITVMPRNTPKANIVCWTPCGRPGAIVMGADPDPNVRAYLLRDASGFFGCYRARYDDSPTVTVSPPSASSSPARGVDSRG